MPQKNKDRIKNREQYEALLQRGMKSEKADRIANAGKEARDEGEKSPLLYSRNRRILEDV